jgi:hypothetical protein
LYLVERNRKTDEIDEVLPALPPSSASSVVSGADSEEEFESALESPYESTGQSSNDQSFDPLSAVSDLISPRYGAELQHPELAHREVEEVEGSGQATPKASDYFTGAQETSSQFSGPNYESLTAALEHARAQEQDESTDDAFMSTLTSPQPETPLDASAPLDDRMMRDVSTSREATSAPSSSSTRLQDASFGAMVGGLTAAALRKRSSSPIRSQRDDAPEQASPVAEPKQPESETIAPVVEPSPKSKGKGKKSKKSKKTVPVEPPVHTPTDEKIESSPTLSHTFSHAPTFVENEDDWIKNESQSIVTDDATLVGEPVATPTDAKGLQQKVMEATAPMGEQSTDVRRATFDDVPQEAARSIEPVKEAKEDLELPTVPTIETATASQDTPIEPTPSKSADVSITEPVTDPVTESVTEPVIEEEVATTPKAKKGKKGKKGKRGSKQVESEPSSLPVVATQADQILPSSESQQDIIEREILEPSFERAETNDKVDIMDFLVQEDVPAASTDEAVPREAVIAPITPANPEEPKMNVPAGPATPELQVRPSTSDGPEQGKSNVEEQRRASTIEGQSGGSGWGSGLWGALGWGKKKAPSPTSSPPSSPKPQSAVLAALAAAREEAKRKGLPSPPIVPDKKISTVGIRPTLSRKTTQDESSKPQLQLETEVKRATVPDQRPTETTRDLVQEQASSSVTPHTAFFTDDGKPPFAFPQPSAVSQEQPSNTVKNVPTVEEKSTKQSEVVTPSTAFFTDDGKPSFTFPPVSSTPAAESTIKPEEPPVTKEAESPAYVPAHSTFFTDNGKPSFTFPTTSTSPAVEPSVTTKEIPIAKDFTALADVSPRSTFFTDDGKPSFSFPSMPSATTEQALPIAKDAETAEGRKPSTFVAPRSIFFTDDGRPSFAFPSASIPAEQAASTVGDTKLEKKPETPTFIAPQSNFFTDDGKPSFAFPSASTPIEPSASINKDTVVEEKAAEPLSLARNALFTGDGKPTSTLSDSVQTESGGSAYDQISLESSSSKKKIIKPKKKTKKSSVPIPDFDEPIVDATKSIDAPIDAAVEARGHQLATEPVERELEAEQPVETPMETAIEAWGEQLVPEPTPLSEEPSVVVPTEPAVKPEQSMITELSTSANDEVTPAATNKKAKKSKKSKKAELESTEVETPTATIPVTPSAERSLEASWNPALRSEKEASAPVSAKPTDDSVATTEHIPVNEPVFAETVQEKIVPSETEGIDLASEVTPAVEEVAREDPSLPQDVPTAIDREAPVEPLSSIQNDVPKTKKTKKSKRKSGISTPQQELEPVAEPSSATAFDSVVVGEKLLDQPTPATDIIEPFAVEATDIPLPAEQADEDLTQLLKQETPKSIVAEQEPTSELPSASVEAELPVMPNGKKDKKSKQKSGTATPQPELEVAPEQATAPIETVASTSELAVAIEETVDRSRATAQLPSIDQVDTVEASLSEQKLDDVADPAAIPLPTASFDEDLSTPLEQPTLAAEASIPAEPKAEDAPSTPTSKKDKKKKGKKSKAVEAPAEEVMKHDDDAEVKPNVMEETKSRETVQEGLVGVETPAAEKNEIPDIDGKDLGTEEVASVLPQERQSNLLNDQAATKQAVEPMNEIPEQAQPTHLEHQSEAPVVSMGNLPVVEPSPSADPVVDDVADAPSSSKKDKKKKKSKKTKAVVDEPSTPVLEEQRELENVQVEPDVASSEPVPEQSTRAASQTERIVDGVVPVQGESIMQTQKPTVEGAVPIIAKQPESPQPAVPIEEEVASPSKEAQERNTDAQTFIGFPTADIPRALEHVSDIAEIQDIPEAASESQPIPESVRESSTDFIPESTVVDVESTPKISRGQSTTSDPVVVPFAPVEEPPQPATPVEEEPTTPSKKKKKKAKKAKFVEVNVADAKTDTQSTTEAAKPETNVDAAPAAFSEQPQQPQVETGVTEANLAADVEFELPVESVAEASRPSLPAEHLPREPSQEASATEPEAVPLPETPAREIDEPVADDQPATPSKKSKKKKAKKGKSTDTEPSTPIAEVATSQPDPFIDSAQAEHATAETAPSVQIEPTKPEQDAPSAELVALPETDDKDLEEPVLSQAEATQNIPAVREVVSDLPENVVGTQPNLAQDDVVLAAPVEPAVEAEPAEPISKKSKKKKGKKGKSIDTTEPSTPATEEPAPQFDVPSDSAQDLKRIEDDVTSSQETTRTIADVPLFGELSNYEKQAREEKVSQDAEIELTSDALLPEPATDDTATAAKLDVTPEAAPQDTADQHPTVGSSVLKPEVADVSSERPVDFAADVAKPVTPLETTATDKQPVSDTPVIPVIATDRAVEADQLTQPVSSAAPLDDVEATKKALPETSHAEEPVEAEAPSTPKKSKKKKKGKKGELVSEPQTPVTESASVVPETTIQDAPPLTVPTTEEPTTRDVVAEPAADNLTKPIEALTDKQDVTTLTEPAQSQEVAQPIDAEQTREEPISGQSTEEATPLTKKDKKKARKARKAELETETPEVSFMPVETTPQTLDELAVEESVAPDAQVKQIQEPVVETQTVPEATSPRSTPLDATIQDAVPLSTSQAEATTMADAAAVPRSQDDAMATQPEVVASVVEQNQEDSTSKKSKKKAKKEKRASIAEESTVTSEENKIHQPEQPASVPEPAGETASISADVTEPTTVTASGERPTFDTTPALEVSLERHGVTDIAFPSISKTSVAETNETSMPNESVPEIQSIEKTPSADALALEGPTAPDVAEEAAVHLSKKDKKKAKKAKRVSIADEATSISPTPTEEKVETVLEEQTQSTPPGTEKSISEAPIIGEMSSTVPDVTGDQATLPASVEDSAANIAPALEHLTQVEAAPETASSVSKKDRESKNSKRESMTETEAETPVKTPVVESLERSLDIAAPTVEQQPSEVASTEPTATSVIVEESSKSEVSSAVPVEEERFSATPVVEDQPSDAATREPASAVIPIEGRMEEPAVTSSAIDEPVMLPKKDKKKAKKSKRGSVAEAEQSVPSTPVDEPVKQLVEAVNDGSTVEQEPAVPVVEQTENSDVTHTSSQDILRSTPATERIDTETMEEDAASKSKEDKKNAKKAAKRASITETESSEPPVSTELLVEEVGTSLSQQPSSVVPDMTIARTTDEAPRTDNNVLITPAVVVDEGNDGKKPIINDDEKTSVKEQQADIAPVSDAAAEITPSDASTLPSATAPVTTVQQDNEQEPEEWAGLSKSAKKKLKKTKRASVTDGEPSGPAAPLENLQQDLATEPQPAEPQAAKELTHEQTPADAVFESTVPGEESTSKAKQVEAQLEQTTATEEPTTDPTPAEDQATTVATPEQPPGDPKPPDKEADSPSTPSKKDKKKAKKQAKKAESFLADETPEAANSDTQPSLSIPTLSETQLPFSGIPTSYSQPFTNNELVDDNDAKIEDAREERGRGEEKKEEDTKDRVTERVMEDVQEKELEERPEEQVEKLAADAVKQEPMIISEEVPEESATEASVATEEPKVIEKPATSTESQEPVVAGANMPTVDIEGQVSTVEERAPESSIPIEPTVVESSPTMDDEPTITSEVPTSLDMLQPHTSTSSEVEKNQPTALRPEEETENVVGEATSTSTVQPSHSFEEADEQVAAPSKKKNKNKKDKRVSIVQEPEQATSILEPERDTTEKLGEGIAASGPKEPVRSFSEDTEPMENVLIVEDNMVAHSSELEADAKTATKNVSVSNDAQAAAIVQEPVLSPTATEQRQDVLTRPETSTSINGVGDESIIAEPTLKDTERAVESTEQPTIAPSVIEQTQEPTFEEPSPSKKSKKKNRKAKQASITAAPLETVPEVQPSQSEEQLAVQLESIPLASGPINEPELSREVIVADQVENVQPSVASTIDTPADVTATVPEELTSMPLEETIQPPAPIVDREAPVEVQEVVPEHSAATQPDLKTSDDLQIPTEELSVPSPSKKGKKKKNKKAKKQFDATAPAEDVALGAPQELNTEAVPAQLNPDIAEPAAEPTPVGEVLVSKPEDVASVPENNTIEPTTTGDAQVPMIEDVREAQKLVESLPEPQVTTEPVEVASQVPLPEDRTTSPPTETTNDTPVILSDLEIPSYAQADQLPTTTVEQKASVEVADDVLSSKKDKKKANKTKAETFDTFTTVDEATTESKVEVVQDAGASSNESATRNAPIDVPQNDAVVETPVRSVDSESSLNDSALPLPPMQEVKEETEKPGSTAPLIENIQTALPDTTLEPVVEHVNERVQALEIQDFRVAHDIAIETPIENAIATPALVEEPSTDTPAVVVESQAGELPSPSMSKKKSKKKRSKKTDAATPTLEAQLTAEPDNGATATEDIVPPVAEAHTSVVPVMNKQPTVEEAAIQPEIPLLPETIIETPATEAVSAASEQGLSPQTAIVEDVMNETDVQEPVVERKLSKKERKKAQKQAAALADEPIVESELVVEPIVEPVVEPAIEPLSEPTTEPPIEPTIEPSTERATAEPLPVADNFDTTLVEPTQESAPVIQEPVVEHEASRGVPEPVTEDLTVRTIESLPQETAVEEMITTSPKKSKKAKKDKKNKTQPVVLDLANEPVCETSELPGQTQASETFEVEPATVNLPQSIGSEGQDESIQHTKQFATVPIEEPSKEPTKTETEPFAAVSNAPEFFDQPRKPASSPETDIAVLPESVPSYIPEVQDRSVPEAEGPIPTVAPPIAEVLEQQPSQGLSSDIVAVAPATVDPLPRSVEAESISTPSSSQPVDEVAHESQATQEVMDDRIDIVMDPHQSKRSKKEKKGKKSFLASESSTLVGASAEPVTIVDEIRNVPETPSENTGTQPSIVESSIPEVPVYSSPILKEEVSFEPFDSTTSINDIPPVITADDPIKQTDVLPTVTEATREVKRPATRVEESVPIITKAEQSQVPYIPDATSEDAHQSLGEQQSMEPIESPIARQEASHVTQDDSLPASELSPSLKVIQDEATNLRLRAESLDTELARREDIHEPSTTEPTSVFDIVKKLAKKDKKKAKKSKNDSDTIPTTPVAKPEVAVETKESVETSAFVSAPASVEEQVVEEREAVNTPMLVEENLVSIDGPSRELSKKEEKEMDKEPATSFDEPHETSTQPIAPIDEVLKPVVEQPREDLPVATEPLVGTIVSGDTLQAMPPMHTERMGPVESPTVEMLPPSTETQDVQETVVDEEPVPSRKLSKKDEKKAEQVTTFKDTPAPLSEDVSTATMAESQEEAFPDYTVIAPVPAPVAVESPVMSVEAPIKLAVEELPNVPRTSSQHEEAPVHAPTAVPTETTNDSLPLVAIEQQETILEEPSIPSRKLSKKERKRGKQDALAAQELEASATRDASEKERHFQEPADVKPPGAPTVEEETIRLEPTTVPRFDAESEVTVTEVQPEPFRTDVPVITHLSESTQEARNIVSAHEPEQEPAITPALVRKESKDKKKSKKQDPIVDQAPLPRSDGVLMAEDVRAEERSVNPLEPMNRQLPIPAEAPVEPIEDAPVAPVTEGRCDLFTRVEPQEIIIPKEVSEERVTIKSPVIEATPEAETITTTDRKQKRKSKTATTSEEEPVRVAPIVPVEETAAIPESNVVRETTQDSHLKETQNNALLLENAPVTPSAPEVVAGVVPSKLKGVHSRSKSSVSIPDVQARATELDNTPQQPLLHKKSSKKHKLAALFERGASQDGPTAERNLRREGSGSVRNLAERYESQSRSVTPVLPPSPEKRHVARVASRSQLGLASPVRSDSKSPAREIDFAATVAASLQESGFDPGIVINDKSFHRSNSISGIRDITPDDDITAAKERASRSRLGSLSRSSSVSGSPKLRPLQSAGPDVLPPIEVAMAPMETASFDPLDVLNDPAFAARKSPGVLEEADPDELAGSSSLRRTKSKKKRHSLPEIPVDVDMINTQEDTLVTQAKKVKKSREAKERAPHQQDSVEYVAAKTPAIEALQDVPLAVETPVDSTVREVEPVQSVPLVPTSTAVLPDVPTQATNISATPTDVNEGHSKKQEKKARSRKTVKEEEPASTEDVPILPVTFDQEPRSLTAEEPREYPFPQVVSSEEISKQPRGETRRRELEEERDMDAWAPSTKKKGKKSRRLEEKAEEESTTTMGDVPPIKTRAAVHEVHKRRTHPVSFDDERPHEKRLHTSEPTQEPQFANERTASPSRVVVPELAHLHEDSNGRASSAVPANEPSWSFAGVQDNVDQAPATPQLEQPAETVARKLRRSKEPKTPLSASKRSIASDRDADSPALPSYTTIPSTSTPSDEYATKERSSHLFDSSPSMRAYGTSPAVAPQTPAHDTQMVVETPSKDNSGSSRAGKKPRVESHHGRASPTKELTQKEPYKSLFGDPNEKKSENVSTPVAKPERTSTPGTKQLESITEVSPDDTTTHKKSRSIADVGVSDRGLKSARRTESLRQLSDRLRSPPPSTPTPTGRRSVQSTVENTAGRDSPWQQVNESVDRTMTLSPARRMPRSSPSADPLKQYIAEQRSPSVQSQRSLSNIARLRSPDQERPLSSLSNHSERSLRRVDRQVSGDLRSASRLGAASAQDAKSAQPNLSSTVLAAGAAAIAGIAAPPVYDPVRGTGRGRRTSMAETFVSSLVLL